MIPPLPFTLRLATLLLVATISLAADEPKVPKHLADARLLVSKLTHANTKYVHSKGEQVVWGATAEAYCDCSGLVNHLLMHSYGYTKDDLKAQFGHARPKAEHYYAAITNPQSRGSRQIALLKDAKPGDLLVVKYAELSADKSTGHVMLMDGPPTEMPAAQPNVEGSVKQWQIPIIDSSRSGHGKTDTRYEKGSQHTGVGRGLLRVYTNAKGEVVAYTWSPESKQTVYPQSTHNLVIGRLLATGSKK